MAAEKLSVVHVMLYNMVCSGTSHWSLEEVVLKDHSPGGGRLTAPMDLWTSGLWGSFDERDCVAVHLGKVTS